MQATLDLPLSLEGLTHEELAWLTAKSAQTGKSTSEVLRDAIRKEARRCNRAAGGTRAGKPADSTNR